MDDEINLKHTIKDFIKLGIKRGASLERIEEYLIEKGYPEEIVKQEISDYKSRPSVLWHPDFSKSRIILIIAIIIVVFASAYIIGNGLIENDCSNELCFTKDANDCKETIYVHNDKDMVFEFITSNDCKVSKKLIALPEKEPQEIKDLLVGKEMVCNYEKDNFNQDLIKTLLGGLENCEGDLKETFYELAIAQYEIMLEEESGLTVI